MKREETIATSALASDVVTVSVAKQLVLKTQYLDASGVGLAVGWSCDLESWSSLVVSFEKGIYI